MNNLRILITILIVLLAICTLNIRIEAYENNDCKRCSESCNYDTDNLDGKLRIVTHNGDKNFWIIVINILTIMDKPYCKPMITGKVIQIPKDKIPDFTKLLTPKTSTNNLYGNGHQLYLENLLKKSPDSLKDILNKNNNSNTYSVSNLN